MNFFNKQPFGLYCFFLLSMLVFPVVIGNTQGGINFSYSTLESIKKQASEQKAFAFIHTTSGNCQTCERLAQNVYPDAKVGSLYNSNFLNFYIDVDRPEHINIANILNLGKESALLYFEPNGKLVKKAVNINTAEELIGSAQEVIHLQERNATNTEQLSLLNKKVQNGKATTKDLKEYIYLLRTYNYPYTNVLNFYLSLLSRNELEAADTKMFIYDFLDNVESNSIDYLLENIGQYKKDYGPALNDKLTIAIYNSLTMAIQQRDDILFERILKVLDKASLPRIEEQRYFIQAQYYEETKNFEAFGALTSKYLSSKGKDDNHLLLISAEKFFNYMNDRKSYTTALNWIENVIKIEGESYRSLLTKARLMRKLGNCSDAIEATNLAYQLAQRDNKDAEEAINLLFVLKNTNCN